MKITDMLNITELSRLTGKTRPTLYKYIKDYEQGNLDNVPYSFKRLFDMISKENRNISEIRSYCRKHYGGTNEDRASELVDLILKNKNKLDLEKIIKSIKEEL